MTEVLKAPFPAFGGKSRVAGLVWPRLSAPHSHARNYVEPFCFSAAMLLLRPDEPKIETVNDLNAYVANFWRAVQADPEAVAEHADWPVNETDLHSRHAWLVRSQDAAERLQVVRDDPDYFDARIAGWWCWGACMWIGSGWCDTAELRNDGSPREKVPHLEDGERGVQKIWTGRGSAFAGDGEFSVGQGVNKGLDKRPQLCNGSTTYGQGVHKRPILTSDGGTGGKGVHKRPRLAAHTGGGKDGNQPGDAGTGVHGNDDLTDCQRRRLWLLDWFTRLSDRLRPVRVCCGHWMRVCDSDSTLTRLGTTAVFLDPPYRTHLGDGSANRAAHIYANDKSQDVGALVDEVQAWCLKWGGNRDIRIAVCGLEGEYPELDAAGWEKVAWKSRGGYGNRTDTGKANAKRERIWFSPFCLKPTERSLF